MCERHTCLDCRMRLARDITAAGRIHLWELERTLFVPVRAIPPEVRIQVEGRIAEYRDQLDEAWRHAFACDDPTSYWLALESVHDPVCGLQRHRHDAPKADLVAEVSAYLTGRQDAQDEADRQALLADRSKLMERYGITTDLYAGNPRQGDLIIDWLRSVLAGRVPWDEAYYVRSMRRLRGQRVPR